MNHLILIVLSLALLLLCCLMSFLSGFLFAAIKGIPQRRKERSELTERERTRLEKEKKEYDNFLKYDGSAQG